MNKLIFIIGFLLLIHTSGSGQNTAFKGKTVYIFLLHDCVICQSYAPYLEDLSKTYQDNFNFVGVFPNFISKGKDIEEFKKIFGITFPTKTDYFKDLSNKFNATVTPEVFIYDEGNNEVLYRGRIDDEFYGIGKKKQVVASHDLENALKGISKGLPYEKSTMPIGCFINFEDIIKK